MPCLGRRHRWTHGRGIDRRAWLTGVAGASLAAAVHARPPKPKRNGQAWISITLDLEMCRDFPVRGQTKWLYEKGNLDEPTKNYTVEACRRIKQRGGLAHCFVVGRVFEQENVDWLKAIAEEGHPVGNHTYDHVNVLSTRREQLQDRFNRAPWLIEGRTIPQVIRENIRLTNVALRHHLKTAPAGFRTPGGFLNGLDGRPDVQTMLLDLGFTWVSSKYAFPPMGEVGRQPTAKIFDSIMNVQSKSQPHRYPTGLIEVPMSSVTDVMAMRITRWPLESWLEALRRAIQWTIEQGAVFDLVAHPAVLVVMDPKFKAIEMVCDMVERAGDRARLVDLDALAKRATIAQ